jgi:hypothetical protein
MIRFLPGSLPFILFILLNPFLQMSKLCRNLSSIAFFCCLTFYCSAASAHSRGIYRTQAEAEKRATELKCKGTFRIDDAWMPCSSEHAMHEALQKN